MTFPPLWTPHSQEVAEVPRPRPRRSSAPIPPVCSMWIPPSGELKSMSDETGLYTTLSDAEIEANKGKTYQDATALRDPLMGLGFGDGDTALLRVPHRMRQFWITPQPAPGQEWPVDEQGRTWYNKGDKGGGEESVSA